MNAKISLCQWIIFIKLQRFDYADIKAQLFKALLA